MQNAGGVISTHAKLWFFHFGIYTKYFYGLLFAVLYMCLCVPFFGVALSHAVFMPSFIQQHIIAFCNLGSVFKSIIWDFSAF